MKNFLIFRSAKHPIVKECIGKISKEYKDCIIWICIQEQCQDMYSTYDNVKFIVFPNGMFNYKNTSSNKNIINQLNQRKYDEVYIPYSTHIPRCEEIEKIVVKILQKKKAVYYGLEGRMEKKRVHIGKISHKKIINNICKAVNYNIMRIIYLFFARRRRND